jgi:pentatricopeptide repeat protein
MTPMILVIVLHSSCRINTTTGFTSIVPRTIQFTKEKCFLKQQTIPFLNTHCSRTINTTAQWAKKITKKRDVSQRQETETDTSNLFTFADYKDQLEALLYLSRVVSDDPGDLCERAQQVFDSMYENWAINEREDLEPTTEIYNLLLSIYASCRNLQTASIILSRMENGQQDGVPSTNVHTYIAMMEGCEQSGKIMEAEEVFNDARRKHAFDVTLFNSMLSLWKRSGDKKSLSKAEIILDDMINGQNEAPAPNTESFALVMECLYRNTSKSKRALVFPKVQPLVETMKTLQQNGNIHVNPNDKTIVNAMIKALGHTDSPDKVSEAEYHLMSMMERYEISQDEGERPNAAIFINVINICSNDQSAKSAEKASTLLKLMENMYQMMKERGMECDDLKPSVRAYNAVMNVWSRCDAHDKAGQAKALLDRLDSLWKSSSDDDFSPNQRTYNTVIDACAYTKGSAKDCSEALRIMIETFNLMRSSSTVRPNHVTYGLFLKGCYNLMPAADDEKRMSIVENIFRKCCKEGCVSEFVLDALFESASSSFLHGIFGDSKRNNIHIPAEWSENVK